jgi:hypothetical protein
LEEKQEKMAIFLDKTNKKVSWLENTIIPEVPAFANTSTSAYVLALPLALSRSAHAHAESFSSPRDYTRKQSVVRNFRWRRGLTKSRLSTGEK